MPKLPYKAAVLVPLAGLICFIGCGLGYIVIEPESKLSFRIENATAGTAEVSIVVAVPERSQDSDATGTQGFAGEGFDLSAAQVRSLSPQATVRVSRGGVTSGELLCGEAVTISVLIGDTSQTTVQLAGAGTGTPGFDSGSIGMTGERFLLGGTDYTCGDTILIKLDGADTGSLEVVPQGLPLPDPITTVEDGDSGAAPITDLSVVTFRLENATSVAADITITSGLTTTDGTGQSENGGTGDDGGVGGSGASGWSTSTAPGSSTVRAPAGKFTTGEIACGEMFTIQASMVDAINSSVLFTGDGTGTPGFDSASVGFDGERLLLFGDHYSCGETIVVRIEDNGTGAGASTSTVPLGSVNVFTTTTTLPEPELPDFDEATESSFVSFRLENATKTAADISISYESGEGEEADTVATQIRTPAGEFTAGEIVCGETFTVSAAIDDTDSSAVMFTGDGTGTEGFDDSSIGFAGERLLVFGDHYSCDETIVIRISDDGSGIGSSTSESALGSINVFESGEPLPDPDLPDPDEPAEDEQEQQITLRIINLTESTVQLNFATGNGTLASSGGTDVSSEFDVRVLPGLTTEGVANCAQEYIIAAAHLEPTSSTLQESEGSSIFTGGGPANFHGIVLTGDGTGTAGFDEDSVAVSRGRLFQLGEHFSCGSTITVTIIATNNQIELDDQGQPVLDEFGNPTIKYNVGVGTVTAGGGS